MSKYTRYKLRVNVVKEKKKTCQSIIHNGYKYDTSTFIKIFDTLKAAKNHETDTSTTPPLSLNDSIL